MGFCETEPIRPGRRIGFVCAKPAEVVWPRASIQLSKIVVAEPLARMLPLLRRCAELAWIGFYETKPIRYCAICGDTLTSGISLALVTIAGFGVFSSLALVSVAYE